MKTLEEVLNNYKEYEVFLDDRFGARLANYCNTDQCAIIIGITPEELKKELTQDEINAYDFTEEWTEENIINQFKRDIKFGYEKAINQRGISADLMYNVCKSWAKVLEIEHLIDEYQSYGITTFEKLAKHFNINLEADEDDK